ncbi:MAG: hypothetical protein WAV56_02600 [Microgenomates group bacterium]
MARERKKRFGWLLFLTLTIWALITATIIWIDPENIVDLVIPGSYFLFGALLFVGIFLFLTIVFLSAKRALWWAAGMMLFLYLRLWGLGSLFNALLTLGIIVCGELYARFGEKV